jgi:hypothetical protein
MTTLFHRHVPSLLFTGLSVMNIPLEERLTTVEDDQTMNSNQAAPGLNIYGRFEYGLFN